MQHSPRPAVMSLVVWSALIPILPFLLSSLLLEGADHITQSLITIDMTTILSLLYLAFVATILGYGIWGALLGRYETWRVAPLSLLVPVVGLASAAVLLGETLTGMQLCGRSTDYGWTLYQCVWISCAPYCARQGMRHYVTKKINANFRPYREVIATNSSSPDGTKKCPAKRGKEVKGVGRYNRARLIHLTYRCSRSRGEGHLADRPHRAEASHRGYFAPQVTKFVLQCHIRRR